LLNQLLRISGQIIIIWIMNGSQLAVCYRWSMLYLRRYQINCAQHISGITFIRYSQNQKIGQANNLKSLEAIKPKGLFLFLSLGRYLCWWIIGTEGIICPVVSVSALTWFLRYIFYWNLQFLNNVTCTRYNIMW
jgi:hypothetical protein